MTSYTFKGLSILRDGSGAILSSQNTAISMVFSKADGSLTGTGDGLGVIISGLVSASLVASSLPWDGPKMTVDMLSLVAGLDGQETATTPAISLPEWALNMMSGTEHGSPILHDVPHFPAAMLSLMSGMETGSPILKDIPDFPGGEEPQITSSTSTTTLFDLPEPGGYIGDNQFSLAQQFDAGSVQAMLDSNGAKLRQVQWSVDGELRSATVLTLQDPDGGEHMYSLKGDLLPEFTDTGQVSAWLNNASFGPPAGQTPGESILLQFDEVDAVYHSNDDMLSGTGGDDFIQTYSGADVVYALAGNDQIHAGAGNDGINGGEGNDLLKGGAGRDTLIGGKGGDRLLGQAGNDLLGGGNGHDKLNGGAGNDVMFGGRGHDILKGGAGQDILVGEKGNDVLAGGAGADRFVFAAKAKNGNDIIQDFEIGIDTIHIVETQLAFEITKTQTGADTLLTFYDTTILLKGINASDLTDDSFVYTLLPPIDLF